jgi:hypothetical protein
MPFYLLLAMQAAGMVVDFLGTKNQTEMMEMGMKVQQAGIEANIEQNKLETADASLQGMKQLRQSLGTTLAVFAARGTNPGAGSALSIFNESIGNFNADDRIRKLNAMGKENQLRANSGMSRLQYNSDVSKLWQGFSGRAVTRFPSSISGWKQGISDAKSEWNKPYFGLTDIG